MSGQTRPLRLGPRTYRASGGQARNGELEAGRPLGRALLRFRSGDHAIAHRRRQSIQASGDLAQLVVLAEAAHRFVVAVEQLFHMALDRHLWAQKSVCQEDREDDRHQRERWQQHQSKQSQQPQRRGAEALDN